MGESRIDEIAFVCGTRIAQESTIGDPRDQCKSAIERRERAHGIECARECGQRLTQGVESLRQCTTQALIKQGVTMREPLHLGLG